MTDDTHRDDSHSGDDGRGDDSGDSAAERLCRGGAAAREHSQAGWRVVELDTAGVTDKAGLLSRLQQAFGFPDWFGHNWDALADALGDVEHPVGTLVVWTGWTDLEQADPRSFATAREILQERAGTDAGGPFELLLAPAG